MWISFSENELDAANGAFIAAHFAHKDKGGLQVTQPEDEFRKVARVMAALDEVLLIRTFLVGERLTLADIAIAFSVHLAYRCNKRYSEELAKRYRHVYRHYNSVMRHPKIKEVMRQAGATLGPLR
ncbi:elongation factor 1-gamma [Strigomonas culicis]|uniref:Elongation factor 1-gamma n=1 Tax=Strigomonas culicis TaxID=28005 RepID=S9W4S8_9TRYP|nr:elongation factor 1-gamma [Strigomonas culicis]|eukprot:EPY30890.1 elongation factor 1-gamma [Strigomonas culicis]